MWTQATTASHPLDPLHAPEWLALRHQRCLRLHQAKVPDTFFSYRSSLSLSQSAILALRVGEAIE